MLTWPTIGAELGGGISILVSGEAGLSSSVFGVSLAWVVVPAVIKGGMVGSGTDAVGGGCRGACPVGESEGTSGIALVVDGGAVGVTVLGTGAVGGECRGTGPVGKSEGTSGVALVIDGGVVGVTVLGTDAARGTRVASLRASSEPSKSITCAAGGGPSFVLAFFRVTSSFLGSRSLALRLEGRRP